VATAPLVPLGMTTHHPSLPAEMVLDGLARARRSVRLLDTSSALIGDSHDGPVDPAFATAVGSALQNGATVRILLLEPTNKAARERAAEIGNPDFDSGVERNLARLRRLIQDLTADEPANKKLENLEVRLYNQKPEMSVHQLDDRVFVSFLPDGMRTSEATQLEVHRTAELGDYAVTRFTRLWETARPLSGMQYLSISGANGAADLRLLVRAWQVDRSWYVASSRVDAFLKDNLNAKVSIEDVLTGYVLGEPLEAGDYRKVWEEYKRIYFLAPLGPGASIRAVAPNGDHDGNPGPPRQRRQSDTSWQRRARG
jgi:hypothetical protein